ncbi:MAG: formate dehydrogenase subunit gamma [bacterium]
MKVQLKKHRGRSYFSFAARSALLLFLFMAVVNFGYLLAQGESSTLSDRLLEVVGAADFINQGMFLDLRSSMFIPSFGIAILVFIGLSLGHLFAFGAKDMRGPGGADDIPWWNLFERVIHWIIAVVFVLLFISGLLITFGSYVGGGGLTLFLRKVHEYSGFVFAPALLITFLMWVKEALPKGYDIAWITKAGGYLGYKGKLVSGKFNAGQKVWFWIMAICGLLLTWTGLGLFFGMDLGFSSAANSTMGTYVVIHFFSAIPIILMFLVHLYMTTLGTKGAFNGMINGKISKSAAMSFHSDSSVLKS